MELILRTVRTEPTHRLNVHAEWNCAAAHLNHDLRLGFFFYSLSSLLSHTVCAGGFSALSQISISTTTISIRHWEWKKIGRRSSSIDPLALELDDPHTRTHSIYIRTRSLLGLCFIFLRLCVHRCQNTITNDNQFNTDLCTLTRINLIFFYYLLLEKDIFDYGELVLQCVHSSQNDSSANSIMICARCFHA